MNLKPLADRVAAILTAAAPAVSSAQSFAGAASPVGLICEVILDIPKFIDVAEELTATLGTSVTGPQKLAAVRAAILAGLNEINPVFGTAFDKAWALIAPVISMIVTFRKFGIKF